MRYFVAIIILVMTTIIWFGSNAVDRRMEECKRLGGIPLHITYTGTVCFSRAALIGVPGEYWEENNATND